MEKGERTVGIIRGKFKIVFEKNVDYWLLVGKIRYEGLVKVGD